MSLLGYDSSGPATINGLNNINCHTLYSDEIYIDSSTTPINVGDALDALQAEIDAIETSLIGIGTGYYAVYGSTNNPSNTLAERLLFFSQTIVENGFTLVTPTAGVASRITATYDGVYSCYWKINYQKVNTTVSYDVRIWGMKNSVDINFSTTIQTLPVAAGFHQVSGNFIVELNAGDYLEVTWLSANASASSDILDYQASVAPYPQVSSQFVTIQQISSTTSGQSDIIVIGSTTTLAAGSNATVTDTTTINPTYTEHSLAFGIPEGATGATGAQGPTGAQGSQGPKGDKGNKGDTGDDGPISIAALALATTAQATAIAAGIVAAGAVSVNTAQDATIAGLAGDIATDEARITALEVVTEDQSWGTFTGTTFSRDVRVTNTGLSVGTLAVYLASAVPSEFLYGLSASSTISTTQSFQSTSGTSSMDSLNVLNNLTVTNNLQVTSGNFTVNGAAAVNSITGATNTFTSSGETEINCAALDINATGAITMDTTSTIGITSVGQLTLGSGAAETEINCAALDINATGAITADTISTITLTSGISETEINCGAFDVNAGSAITVDSATTIDLTSVGLTTINSAGLDINAGAGNITVDTTGTFALATNGDITIQTTNPFGDILISSAATNTLTSVGDTTINTVAFDVNSTGVVTLDTTSTITTTSTGLTTINSAGLDINAGAAAVTLDTTSTITTTSTGETEINCAAFDLNAGGNITIDTPATTILTSEGITLECPLTSLFGIIIKTNETANDIDITTIGAVSDINLLSTAATITLTAGTEADITCATLDLNASTAATLDAPTITLTSTGETEINCAALDINATGAITADTDDPITITSTSNGITLSSFGEQDITCGSLDINSAGTATIDSTSNMSLTSGGKLTLGSGAGETEINCGLLDINASGNITMDGQSISITSGGGNDITITAADDLIIASNQITMTNNVVAATSIIHNSVTTGTDLSLQNSTKGSYLMRLSATGGAVAGLTLEGVNNGINTIKSLGAASTLLLDSANDILMNSVGDTEIYPDGTLTLSSGAGNDVLINGAQNVNIIGLAGGVSLNGAAGNVEIDASDDINLTATDITITTTVGDLTIFVPTAGRFVVNNNGVQKLRISGVTAEFNVAITTDSTLAVAGASTLTGGFTSSASSNMNHNFLIQQSTYPPSSTSALGYTGTVTVTTSTLSASITQEATWNLPSKGVWLICATVTFSTNSAADTEFYQAVISTTTNSATEASAGLSYYQEDDQVVGAANVRDKITLSGVVRVNAATALFFNAAGTTTGTAPSVAAAITYTRLG